MEEYEVILVSNPLETRQIDGWGRNIEEIFLKLNIHGLIDEDESRKFLIEVSIKIKETTYKYSNQFSKESIDDQGIISVGTIYVRGPVQVDEIQYHGTITFVRIE